MKNKQNNSQVSESLAIIAGVTIPEAKNVTDSIPTKKKLTDHSQEVEIFDVPDCFSKKVVFLKQKLVTDLSLIEFRNGSAPFVHLFKFLLFGSDVDTELKEKKDLLSHLASKTETRNCLFAFETLLSKRLVTQFDLTHYIRVREQRSKKKSLPASFLSFLDTIPVCDQEDKFFSSLNQKTDDITKL